ncbi:hypothetical protein TBLA_0F02300 [Henningerozyma blattae CBS 6284]|uniref:Sas10 C-terminal domain-containing protein n=1 Tax=Henningerozyma blattae (strain ATCC 34711 / CBS 6284 / DSM 70876 / NBRC 10599 / NRRL Y-10934 / UCD 77-7) TaxID=1071380 RepID=I2H5W9_HENB6|nr:hypothetical protein TBLA_0F02300 [Tetrapisispora blattae CBS 6284]CCH61771.1 hypothetical protein TBLA_0F02300 [Tetrapisispora blattae CBS 6284]
MAPARNTNNEDPYGLNEVDDFARKSEKILFENSTLANRRDESDDNPDDEEEEVLAIDESSSSEDESQDETAAQLDGADAYKKIFGRKMDTYNSAEENENAMLDQENAWGVSKSEYYGADDLDDDETAKEIEKEALRQQKKHLEELNMGDYLDDEIEEEWVKDAKEFDVGEFKESTKQEGNSVSINDILNMDLAGKKNYLQSMIPEFFPLSQELTQLTSTLKELKSQEQTEFIKLKVLALSGYLGTISSYFGLLLSELNNNEDFTSMKEHPVMESILTSKEIWRQANELPDSFENTKSSNVDEEQVSEDEEVDNNLETLDENILQTVDDVANPDGMVHVHTNNQSDIDEEEESEVDLDDFEEYVAQPRIANELPFEKSALENDDYVESEMLDIDAQEKMARKKTLRFYTAKIDQQDKKKKVKFNGDDDIPYKERLYKRQQQLIEEARKRGLSDSNGADLDDNDYKSEDEAASKVVNTAGENDYYNEIKASLNQKKEARIQAHKKAQLAARDGKLAELAEEVGVEGKRAINYQILKNKGLTPNRKKENRNSRVKKRKRYEKAQKKLKSVRAVYSGGQSGAYEGEKTGIKKNLSRSVRFKN